MPKKKLSRKGIFFKFASITSEVVGSPGAFILAMSVVIIWGISGPLFGFSDTWQLVINTSTTIVTFLIVFLIQNSQNRDAKATQLKLDELIRSISEARDELVDVEDSSDEEIKKMGKEFSDFKDDLT